MLTQKPSIVISDLRLRDDTDEHDTSGMRVIRAAKDAGIPAILSSNTARKFPGLIVVGKDLQALIAKVKELIG